MYFPAQGELDAFVFGEVGMDVVVSGGGDFVVGDEVHFFAFADSGGSGAS